MGLPMVARALVMELACDAMYLRTGYSGRRRTEGKGATSRPNSRRVSDVSRAKSWWAGSPLALPFGSRTVRDLNRGLSPSDLYPTFHVLEYQLGHVRGICRQQQDIHVGHE